MVEGEGVSLVWRAEQGRRPVVALQRDWTVRYRDGSVALLFDASLFEPVKRWGGHVVGALRDVANVR